MFPICKSCCNTDYQRISEKSSDYIIIDFAVEENASDSYKKRMKQDKILNKIFFYIFCCLKKE